VRGHFGAVLGRQVGVALLSTLVGFSLGIIIGLATFFLPSSLHFVANVLVQAVLYLSVYPIVFGAYFSLYAALKTRVPNVDTQSGRGGIIALAWFGVVGFLAILIIGMLSTVVLASLNTAHLSVADAARTSNLKEIQLGLALYYDSNNSSYPTTLAPLVAEGDIPAVPTDPATHQPFTYVSDGTTYSLCATLSTGKQDCMYSEPSSPSAASTGTAGQPLPAPAH
jgi:type II secretory pathway pseudopilin PulG